MNNKYYLATVLLALGAFSPLYGVQNGGGGGGAAGGGGGGRGGGGGPPQD